MKRKKTLAQIIDHIKRRLGSDVVFVEAEDLTIEDFVFDALSLISQYKPKVIAKTLSVSNNSGKIQLLERVYPEGWVQGNALPTETPVDDIVTFLNVETAEPSRGYNMNRRMYYNSSIPGTTSVSYSYNCMSAQTSRYIDYKIMQYNLDSMQSLDGYQFDWMRDENDPSAVFFCNKPHLVSDITIEVGVEHLLGSYVAPPASDAPNGTPATTVERTLSGSILALTQDLALGKTMETIGRIRRKVAGGQNSTPLDGASTVADGLAIQEKVMDSLKNNPNHWGMFAD